MDRPMIVFNSREQQVSQKAPFFKRCPRIFYFYFGTSEKDLHLFQSGWKWKHHWESDWAPLEIRKESCLNILCKSGQQSLPPTPVKGKRGPRKTKRRLELKKTDRQTDDIMAPHLSILSPFSHLVLLEWDCLSSLLLDISTSFFVMLSNSSMLRRICISKLGNRTGGELRFDGGTEGLFEI